MQDSDNKRVFEKGLKAPAGKDLREVLERSKLLGTKQQKQFHSTTARVLYLTNRAKSTCNVACQALCSRLTAPTADDERKLIKLLSHLWETRRKKYLFGRGDGSNHLHHYIDGAFACHMDGKSHGGWLLIMECLLLIPTLENTRSVRKTPPRLKESRCPIMLCVSSGLANS